MGRASTRKRERALKHTPVATPPPFRWKLITRLAMGTCAVLALAAAITFSIEPSWLTGGSLQPVATALVTFEPAPANLNDLLALDPAKLANLDIAHLNLLCAEGLPGAKKLNIEQHLARLDEWAQKVRYETQRHLYRARDPQWAEHYKHSENWLRAEFLVQVLQEDCGVHYNMERVRDIDFTNSKDLFIHGMIDDPNGGTCASMPVLYVGVGRRLGYPLKLVTTKAHVFVRWDDGTERFNIETTSTGGTDSYPDEHYETWPYQLSDAEIKDNRYLVSLTPAEELAAFLASRGHCLLDNGKTAEAREAYAAANRLVPTDPALRAWLAQAEARINSGRRVWSQAIAQERADGLARMRRSGGGIGNDAALDVERINAINQANMERMMRPTGAPQPARP